MKPISIHAEAEDELRSAMAYYECQRERLGGEFRSEVEAALLRIQQNPKAYTPYDDQGVRRCVIYRFPYKIFYVEFDDVIWIAAVAHQKRRPGYWAGRTP